MNHSFESRLSWYANTNYTKTPQKSEADLGVSCVCQGRERDGESKECRGEELTPELFSFDDFLNNQRLS